MITLNISLPEGLHAWITSRVEAGDYADASEYLQRLLHHDREHHDALVQALIEGEESGESPRNARDILRDILAADNHG